MSAPEIRQKGNPLLEYMRREKLPHFFCPGCGCGQVTGAFLRAVDALGLDLGTMVGIGGVGCTARIPVYIDMDTLHGVHGRTLAWATGIKLHKPETKVVIFAGDGDALAIGGNHFIHAARRNLDVAFVVVNNFNFAMTGGQVAPMTPDGTVTMTTPYGSSEPPFDLCSLAVSAGATYVARTLTSNPRQMTAFLKSALSHRGFSVVEILSQCPTHFGRYALGSGSPKKLVDWIRDQTLSAAAAEKMTHEEMAGKFLLGEFVKKDRPVFRGSTLYQPGAESEESLPEDNERTAPSELHGERISIRFCGVGGQGIILSSVLLGEAAVTKEGLHAAQTQSYGSEARGGQCQAEVVVSKNSIGTPTSERNDILVAMFQSAYDAHRHRIKEGGKLFVDSGLVSEIGGVSPSVTVWKVPAVETAIRLGNRMAGNMVMLGFLQEKTGVVSKESLLETIRESVKAKFVGVNLAAFEKGVRLARNADAP